MKKSLLRIPFLICFLLSLISQVALAQTTIDFNDLSAGLFLTKSYDKNGFNFSINAVGGGQIVTRNGDGYQTSTSLYDNNLEIGALTQWTIKKIDGTEFQFHSIFLKEPNIGASTSGTIQGFKNGNAVGSSKTVDFNGLKSFASDSDFYDIDEIRISAADINFDLDHFTFGPVYTVDTAPAVISTVSIVGSPGPFATSISYSVTFNKSVTGVSTDDFQLTTTSTVTGDIDSVSGSGSSYTVTVNNISGIGTIRLDLKGGTNIANTNGNVGTPEYTSGPVHTLSDCGVETFEAGTILDGANSFTSNDKSFTLSTGFEIESRAGFGAVSPGGGSALSNKFIKNNNSAGTFSISSAQDFTMSSVDLYLSSTPAGNTPTSSGSLVIRGKRDGQIQYSITKTNGFPTSTSVNGGFFTIDFATAGVSNYRNVNIDELEFTIADGFIELLVDNFNYCKAAPDVDVLAPKVISLIPDPAALSNSSNVNFQVIFDEDASGVSIDDFALSTTGTVSGAITGVTGSGSVYTVSVTGISGEGSIRVDLTAGNDIRDDLNNSPSPAFTGQEHLVGACFIETFEDETDGAKSFTGNGITFNLVGNWEIDRATPSTGIYGSKVNTVSTGAGPYSITSTDGLFIAKKLALFVSSLASGTSPTNNGTVKIRGYEGGSMKYEWNQLGGFPTDFTSNNGYFIVDLDASFDSEIEVLKIDRLEITLGGSFVYFNLENFEWCADNTAPLGYTVAIDQDAINDSNRTNVSFTLAGAELGTTYNYTFTSTGGGTAVTGLGTITSANQQITGIDLSSLGDGTITLSVVLEDTYGNIGLPAEDTVIKSLNSAPVVQVPSAPTVYEDDVQVPIAGFTVSDPEGDNVMLTFTVTGGTVSIGIDGVWFGGGGNGSSNFTASSSPAAINAALEELTFTPTPDLYGTNAGEISIIAFDGILNSAVTSVTFDIIGINDDPTITGLPATITVEEDSNEDLFDISTASIGDIDAGSGNLSLILVANGGVFDVAAGTGMTIYGHLADSLTLTGNLINLNNYIDQPSNIYFRPDQDLSGNGAASIEVYLNDNGNTGTGGGQTLYQGSISVNITAVNDAPKVANPIPDQQANQDEIWSYQFAANTFTDADGDALTYTAELSGGGALPSWLSFTGNNRTFSGTPGSADVGTLEIKVTANDGNGETVSDTFSLQVTGINVAPSIAAPTSLTTNEDTALFLSGISFQDPDAGTNSVTVEMSTSNATLSATSGGGVTVTYNATTLLLSGSIADINTFIASGGVKFTPNANVFGDLLLEIHINDNGHSGSGGALTANKDVTIEVTAVNDSPVISSPSTLYFLEDEMSPIIGISFSDVDAGSQSVGVFFNIATGTFTANSGGGVTVVGSGGTSLTLNGSIADINAFIAAENLQYTPALNSTTTTLLSVSINDNGHSGSGGATSRQALVFFQISGVNDAPVNHVPGAQYVELGEVLEFSASNGNSISISDVDAGINSLQVTLTVTNGTISYTLHPSASLSTGTGLDDTYVEIFGTISQINETLEGMVFTPNPGFIGLAQIEIVTNDQGYVGAGNAGTDTDIIPIQVGPIHPIVTSVRAESPNGTYKIGDTVTLEVAFNQDVTVTGMPSLTLETGSSDAIATYISGSGSSVLTFEFTVEEGHISYLLDYTGTNALVLNDGSIMNSTDLDAALTLPNPGDGGSLSANSALIVDGIRPTASINVDSTLLTAGSSAGVTVIFSEVVVQLDATDFTVGNGTISDPETLDGMTWTFVLTPSSGVSGVTNIVLDNTGFMDAAGNTGVGTTPSNNYKVDTVLPTSSIEVKEETLIIDQTSQVIITFNEPILGLEVGDLAVENGFLSDLESTDGGTVWTATLTPTPGVESATNVISLNNSSVSDLSGNVGASTATSNSYLVDTKAPTVIVRNRNFILDASGHIHISDGALDNGSTDGMGIATRTPSHYNFNCSNVGLNTVTLTVTDVNGNSANATAIVIVEDGAAPTVVTRNITIQLDATGNASITAAEIDNGSSDSCGIASMTLDKSSFDCGDVGANTVTLTVTDVNGNTESATANVTVEDVTAPVAVTRNITIQLDATGTASITAADIDNGSTDSCGIASMTLSQYSFDCSHVGDNTVTLTVTDVNGNTDTATAIVTVEDITAPVVVTRNITIQLDATGNASITAADIDNGSTDSCGIASMTLSQYDFDCSHVGDNTVTLTVTDANGNTDTATAIVTVEDVTAPVAVTRNITIQLDATGNASITAADINNGSTDSCGIASMTLDKSSFDCGDVGANTVTLTVTDVNGNTESATAIVTVEDVTDPVVVTKNITIQLDATGSASITAAEIDNGSSDSCGIASMTLSQYDFDCSHVGDNTVTLTVTDLNGNMETATANVTVEDVTAPVAVTQNITIQLDATGTASISATSIDNGSTDSCGIASMTLSQYSFDCSHVGDNTVTLTVTDVNGNTDTATAIVTVEDITAPVVVTQNITIQLDATGNASITAADIDNGSTDSCGIASMSLSQYSFDCSHVGDNTVTLTVTDVNGNTDSAEAIVTVEDITAPVVVTRNITIQLDATGNASITAADIDNGSTDACGIASMTLDKSSFYCGDVGANTVTLTITDVNGNTDNATAIVTVEDVTAPVVATRNITVKLTAIGTISLEAEDIDDGSFDSCGLVSLSLSKSVFGPDDIGANTVTLTVTDSSGNQSSGTAIVTIVPLDIIGLTFLDNTFVYDGTPKSLIITGNLPEGTTVNYTDNTRKDVGAQQVVATVAGPNYTTLILTATLTVTPADLFVVADSGLGKLFGEEDPELTYTATGYVAGDDKRVLSGTLDREAGEAIGLYSVTSGTLDAGSNYTLNYTGADFEILSNDADGDGVPDHVELIDGTDPYDPDDYKDTDGDGVPDVIEPEQGTNPADPSDYADSDKDHVPDYVEERQGTDPDDKKDFADKDGNGFPDYVEVRAITEFVAQGLEAVWGTALEELSLPTEVLAITGLGEVINLSVNWNLAAYDPLRAGTTVYTGTVDIPGGVFNPYGFSPNITIAVLEKPAPENVILSENEYVGIPDKFFQDIGVFTVIDPSDGIHRLSLPEGEGDNAFFEVNSGILFWSSADQQAGRVEFTVVLLVQDRAGNELRKSFAIRRLRTPLSQLDVTNTFTPNADGANDTWGIPALRYYGGVKIQVFDNAGNRVFYTENPDVKWDGTSKGKEQPISSYIYVIEVGETGEIRRGMLNLLRQ